MNVRLVQINNEGTTLARIIEKKFSAIADHAYDIESEIEA